jgi:hypothetical protein
MLVVETIAKVRRAHFVQGKGIKTICREFGLSRKIVRKVLRSGAMEFRYERTVQPLPKLGRWRDELDRLLTANECPGGARAVDADPDLRRVAGARAYNRRFLQMCRHYLVDPSPALLGRGGRRVRSRTRLGCCASSSSRRGCG